MGYRHLKNFIDDEEILLGILHHHERLDGSGYSKLPEDKISEFGKIIAVADVFSAMTSVRLYKKASTCNRAIKDMTGSNGFDCDLVNILINMYIDGKVGSADDSSFL